MKVSVVILNWNTVGYLEKFIPGILHSLEGLDAELVVADSASTDGSLDMIATSFPEVRRIPLSENYGFTGGYNRALKEIDAEYYVLLNSDIEVTEGWLKPLLDVMDNNPDIGACAPKLHSWYDRDNFEYAGAAGGYIDSLGFPFCRGRIMKMVEKDNGQYDVAKDVLWATGACLMVRSSLFHKLGGLDDRFFAHMEEIDLCWRMQLEGYRVRIVPESVVYHLGGGTLPQNSPWKLKLNYRNNLMLLQNNLARTYGIGALKAAIEAGKVLNGSDLERLSRKACRKANRKIFSRMLVDGLTGLAYLGMLKWQYFKAVIEAHSEFRAKSRNIDKESIKQYLSRWSPAEGRRAAKKRSAADGLNVAINGRNVAIDSQAIPTVTGIYPHWIIPRAILLKDKTFGYIRRQFESSAN